VTEEILWTVLSVQITRFACREGRVQHAKGRRSQSARRLTAYVTGTPFFHQTRRAVSEAPWLPLIPLGGAAALAVRSRMLGRRAGR
jgi:hypothetical protein